MRSGVTDYSSATSESALGLPPEASGPEKKAQYAAQLARLYRGAAMGELSEATRSMLKALLYTELGMNGERQEPVPATKQVDPQAQSASSRVASQVIQPAVTPTPPPQVATASSLGAAQLELKLRQLLDASAPWDVMEPLAIKLFAARPTDAAAARVIELAFVHASTERLEPLLTWARRQAPGFYRHMHPTLRTHLVVRMWKSEGGDMLATILFRERDESYLQPIERLFVFQSMASAKDGTVPYLYFRRFQPELVAAAKSIGSHVGCTPAGIMLRAGQLALDLGYVDEAGKILESIGVDTPERDEALRLMLTATVEKNKAGRSHLAELLMAESSASGRLVLLEKFLHDSRGLGGFKDRSRPALNEILTDPLGWLPSEAEAISKLSSMLTGNRDLASLLPNLYAVFKRHATKFLTPNLDLALWHGPLTTSAVNPIDDYWRGVALLHYYVATGPSAEAELWQAMHAIKYAQEHAPQHLPISWKDLHRAAFNWVLKATQLLDGERTRMLRQMRVTLAPDQINLADLADYAQHVDAAPLSVLNNLQASAEHIKEWGIARSLLLKRAAVSHLTNADISQVWQMAITRSEHDMAWRAATVAHVRQALVPAVRHAWEFSGEKRSEYGLFAPQWPQVKACMVGLSPAAARLANSCLVVGAALPELLAMLDSGATVTRSSAAPHDSLEARVDQALASVSWLQVPKRRYRFSFESALGGTPLPSFMQVLPANVWSLVVARIAERLGINAWGWRLSRLHAQVADLIPRLASRQDLRRQSGKVAAWLKELSPEQRTAWQDMAALGRSLDDHTAVASLAAFVCRLATLICPNHYMALTSLQAMRAPAAIIWDLETWLLGDVYSKLRLDMGTVTRVPVPNSLQRLTSIIAKADMPKD